MALPGSQRRGQRRRLLMAWSRDTAPPSGGRVAAARTPAEYDPVALPERQPAVATLLPTHRGRLAAWAVGIAVAVAAVVAPGLHAPTFSALERAAGPRFARTVAAAAACFDAGSMLSLAGWLSHVLLVVAAAVALVVRFMRRHRRDDFAGRYRAWGWLAGLLVAASCSAQAPVGRAVGIFMTEATGVAFGPAGSGWWVAIAATLFGGVSLWAVLPLHERAATALWLASGLMAWGVSAAAVWFSATQGVHPGVAPAAWAAGSGLLAIAMLVAARSVIREVRGEAKAAAPKPQAAAVRPLPMKQAADEDDEPQESPDWGSDPSEATGYTDGSDSDEDRDTRHLSKAERKRLKKLARMNRVA